MSATPSLFAHDSDAIAAFQQLVASNGHVVDEWFAGDHDTDEGVVLYGDCSRCLTELQFHTVGSSVKPSRAAAALCFAPDEDADEDADDEEDWDEE